MLFQSSHCSEHSSCVLPVAAVLLYRRGSRWLLSQLLPGMLQRFLRLCGAEMGFGLVAFAVPGQFLLPVPPAGLAPLVAVLGGGKLLMVSSLRQSVNSRGGAEMTLMEQSVNSPLQEPGFSFPVLCSVSGTAYPSHSSLPAPGL